MTWNELAEIIEEMSPKEHNRPVNVVYYTSLGNGEEGEPILVSDRGDIFGD